MSKAPHEPTRDKTVANIRVRDGKGDQRTVFETWCSVGRFGLVAERRFRLSTGEAVEQAAEDVFVVLTTNETLIRVRQASARGVQSENAVNESVPAKDRRALPVQRS